jgi:hypothetical protein
MTATLTAPSSGLPPVWGGDGGAGLRRKVRSAPGRSGHSGCRHKDATPPQILTSGKRMTNPLKSLERGFDPPRVNPSVRKGPTP